MAEYTSARRRRVALLNTETDVQREAAATRASSVQSKASFLVLAAGVVATSALFQPTKLGLLAFSPLVFTLASVILAAIALWPANLRVIDPRLLKNKWIDARASDYELEVFLLEAKVRAYEEQQARTNTRVRALKAGFVLFVIAIASLLAVAISSVA
jgi:p-aminobenzoyl-glutamate transporter AbgT